MKALWLRAVWTANRDELWATARYDLRLSDAEFSRLTLRQFVALQKRWNDAELRLDLRAGQMCVAIAAPWTEQRLDASDFYPSLKELEPMAMSDDEIMGFAEAMHNARKRQQDDPTHHEPAKEWPE